ncbi:SLAM family member 7-like isoform X5 [Mobula birostris]|uniref:SLAM family member 7-like isoform X5 n=1 Tax=Mobula birostris TaxID=1983395 RepID=UPI003B27FBC9
MSKYSFYAVAVLFLRPDLIASAGHQETWKVNQEFSCAIGGSILLPGFNGEVKNVQHIRWEFGDTRILDYYDKSKNASFTNPYRNRCTFFSSNGSLLLKNLVSHDEGLYKITINLEANSSKVIKLNVIERLSKPLISGNSTFVDTDIALACQVPMGIPRSILWMKDNEVITSGQYQFMEDNRTLLISQAKKSDCGMYSCLVENAVSQENSSYQLDVYGYSDVPVTLMVILCLLLTLVILAMCSMKEYHTNWINKMFSTKFCRVILDVVSPLSGIIVICSSSILISKITKESGKGCKTPANLQTSIILTVVVPLIVLVIIFTVYALFYAKDRKQQRGNRTEQQQDAAIPLTAGDPVNGTEPSNRTETGGHGECSAPEGSGGQGSGCFQEGDGQSS